MRSRPAPPYSSGAVRPNSPISFICSTIFSGYSSLCSSSSATGMTSVSTKSRTAATISFCSSERSTSPPLTVEVPAMASALLAGSQEFLERLLALQPSGAAPHGQLLGHLPRGLVDHLGAEHDRPAELHVGRVSVRLQDGFGLVVLLLCGGEHLVQHLDLAGVQGPLPVVAQGPGPQGHLPE